MTASRRRLPSPKPKPFSVLMCAPSHYDIRYEINPWMKIRNPIDAAVAMRQWEGLKAALESLGVRVFTIPQRKNCPDMVFTANAGVVSGSVFAPSHFRYPQRQPEEPAFRAFFRRAGLQIRDLARGMFFEGEGDLLPFGDAFVGGFRFRSEIRAHEAVARAFGRRLVGLELTRPHFYHLDTCFLPVDDRTALYFPDAFNAAGRKALASLVPDLVPVSEEDAKAFACNGLRVGRTIIMNKAGRRLRRQLSDRGFRLLETPVTEFMKAGGSVKCLLLKL